MDAEKRTIKGWAGRLSIEGELLTLEEARTLATIAGTDRLLEIRDILQDVQMRLQRFELWAAANIPGYDQQTRALAKALAEHTNGKDR